MFEELDLKISDERAPVASSNAVATLTLCNGTWACGGTITYCPPYTYTIPL